MAQPELTLATINALIGQCGCCELPRCCPPLLECISTGGYAHGVGWLPDDSGSGGESDDLPDWKKTHYQRFVRLYVSVAPPDQYETHPIPGEPPYLARTQSTSIENREVDEISHPFAGFFGVNQNGSACRIQQPTISTYCEISGSATETNYGMKLWNGQWVRFQSSLHVHTPYSVAGQRTDSHIEWEEENAAWELAHPDFPAELAQWELDMDQWEIDLAAWEVANTAYLEALDQWIQDGRVGDPPEGPGDIPPQPERPPDPPDEPEEFYPPCTFKTQVVSTYWDYNDSGVVLVEEEDENGDPIPNPITIIFSGIYFPVNVYWKIEDRPGLSSRLWEAKLEMPITFQDFFTQAEDWMNEQAEEIFDLFIEGAESASGVCLVGDICGARKFVGPYVASPWIPYIELTNFRHRWKLNKCCGYKRVLSGWREVFFPLEYMQWYNSLAALGSSDDIPAPPVDLDALAERRQWLWEGQPPLCNDSSSSSSEVDPFDHEPMWSPWSLTVKVPDGEEGLVLLRNYFQICYGNIPDPMPDVTGQINLSDSIPDGWTL